MRHGHPSSTDRAKAVAAQQVQSQGAQQRQHLNAIAVAVAMGVLAELRVAGPVPLVFVAARLLLSSTPSAGTSRKRAFGLVRRVVMK